MYSRYDHREDRPIRLPENYGGTAFSESHAPQKASPRDSAPPRQLEIGKPTPPPNRPLSDMPVPPRPISLPPLQEEKVRAELPPTALPAPAPPVQDEKDLSKAPPHADRRPTAFLQPFQGLFGHMGNAFPFGHGIGFDELLIIGLMILLSRTEQESDVVLWLALLLFCG